MSVGDLSSLCLGESDLSFGDFIDLAVLSDQGVSHDEIWSAEA